MFRPSRERFDEYAREWIERYQGIRESTRDNYRRDLERYGIPFLGGKRLGEISGRDLAKMVAWLLDEQAQARHHDQRREEAGLRPSGRESRPLSDATIANAMKPVRACLASAKTEHQIRVNPARDLRLPRREQIVHEEDEEGGGGAQAFTREQLAAFLRIVHPKHRLLFEVLASTGLRISEALALQWRHLDLDLGRPKVRVRQQFYRGRFQPPKTRKGRREVPLPGGLAAKLRERRDRPEWTGPEDLVFPNEAGRPLHVENLRRRHLRAVVGEAGAPWAGFHTFRHTFASLKFEGGSPVTEVSQLLGHSTPRVTLDVYLHWLDSDATDALDLDQELLAEGGNKVGTRRTQPGQGPETVAEPDSRLSRA